MSFPISKTRRHRIALGMLIPALIVLFLISGVFQWSPLNCWHEEIDLNSGRIRHTHFLLYCQVSSRIEKSWLSRGMKESDSVANWKRVNTFSPGTHHSPRYQFHSAIHQINLLQLMDSHVPFVSAARLKVSESVLNLWQESGGDSGVNKYIEAVSEVSLALEDQGASFVSVNDLPTE